MTPSTRRREEGFPDARKAIKPLTVGNRSGFNSYSFLFYSSFKYAINQAVYFLYMVLIC